MQDGMHRDWARICSSNELGIGLFCVDKADLLMHDTMTDDIFLVIAKDESAVATNRFSTISLLQEGLHNNWTRFCSLNQLGSVVTRLIC